MLRARGDPEPLKKDALGRELAEFGRGRSEGDGFEIHMGCQIGLAGIEEGIGRLMCTDGLKRIPQRAPIAIVDNQRHATMGADPAADVLHDVGQGRA